MKDTPQVVWDAMHTPPPEEKLVLLDKHLGFYDARYYLDPLTDTLWKHENKVWFRLSLDDERLVGMVS